MKSYTLGLQSRQNHHIHQEEKHDLVSASRYTPKLGGCKPGPLCLWSRPPAQMLLGWKRCRAWRLHSLRFRLTAGLAQKLKMTSVQFRFTFSPRSHARSTSRLWWTLHWRKKQVLSSPWNGDTRRALNIAPYELKPLHRDCEGGRCFTFPSGAREFNDTWTGSSCFGVLTSGTHVLWE